MRFEEDIKLDFSDVLMKPKRSTLSSRQDVNLFREFKNPDSSKWECVPIIAANMDTVGSFEMATELSKINCLTALHKHYTVDQLIQYFENNNTDNVFYSMGTSDADVQKLNSFLLRCSKPLSKLCIDVANGYSEKFVGFVKAIREKMPNVFIMAGNVVTPEMTEELILSGVDCVKIGIGPGCFTYDTKVLTKDKKINISDIKVGDYVLTHKNQYKRVTSTMKRLASKHEMVVINGVKTTKNHNFFVIDSDKHNINDITEKNYLEFGEWIPAGSLTDKHYIVKL